MITPLNVSTMRSHEATSPRRHKAEEVTATIGWMTK